MSTTCRALECQNRNQMWKKNKLRLLLVPLLFFVAGCTPPVLVNCNSQINAFRTATSHADSTAARAAMISCVNVLDTTEANAAARAAGPEGMNLARMYFEIPEYHDEGRLPKGRDGGGTLLGPRAAIFASPFLNGFKRPSQIFEQGIPGTLVAIVFVDPDPEETIPASYRDIGLTKRVNCIWLAALTPSDKKYRAFISHPVDSVCNHAKVSTAVWYAVTPVHNPAFAEDTDYPPVARFDTDASGERPVLGFRCLDAFCEIGPNGYHPRNPLGTTASAGDPTALTAAGPPDPAEQRVRTIKGWHDEQRLAYQDMNFVWRASDVRAAIFPNPKAAGLDSGDFAAWQLVATVVLSDDPPVTTKYAEWGLRKGDNKMSLQQDAERHWKMKVTPAIGPERIWSNTVRTVHHDVALPATARFRWTNIDEGVWVPCGQACCRSDGGGGT